MIRKIIIPLFCIIIIMCVGGVSATWLYAESSPAPVDQSMNLSLAVFDYPPEQILPGGDENNGEVELGSDHFRLVNLIVNEADKGYNLNNNNSLLHDLLDDDAVVYCNQKVSGGNLKFVLDEKNNTYGLYYTMEKVNDNLYYIYTFSIDDLSTVGGTDIEMCVYRTTLEKTNKWAATVSHIGYAKTLKLRDVNVSVSSQSLSYSVDVNTWHL